MVRFHPVLEVFMSAMSNLADASLDPPHRQHRPAMPRTAPERARGGLNTRLCMWLGMCLWMSTPGILGCDKPEVPTEEYAEAMKAYERTTLQTLGSAGADPRWGTVVAQLRTVPKANATEHRKAKALADSIEARQQEFATIEQRSGAAADEYLRTMAERPGQGLPTAMPARGAAMGGAAMGGAAMGGAATSGTGRGARTTEGGGAGCAADCQAQEDRCFGSAGCKRMGTTWMCTDDASARSGWCHQQARSCRTGCSGGGAPSSTGCLQACDHQANGCYLAVPGCHGSGTNWKCEPGSSARGTWCASQRSTCRQQCG
jgi:hypothetical protein